ncbi:heat shock protein 23-like [Musca vetustissima]|uniref:heat shock protein 23-like n=1 Tax=Musca vetustissima TaxID=27455 RepID=UPI002AB5E4DF|nr:heat shock protein 23-like [Musca vetustissima]
MANLPLLLSLADDLNRLSLASPFYDAPFSYLRRLYTPSLVGGDPPRIGDELAGPVSTIGKDGFQVCIDVQQFKPNELNVKVTDNCIVVEGKHEEREDDRGYISRSFVRRYALPKGYDPNQVVSTLSSDGVLTVSVPKPQIENKTDERIVQIQQVGPAHLNVKLNPKESQENEKKPEAQSKL